ncbi:ferric reductase like transmembrane component-domain-containing protein [Pyronema omphalodes]|nr:ferric reductase like transmembrane component-domain-containing protein [Pyronema omphalodes]
MSIDRDSLDPRINRLLGNVLYALIALVLFFGFLVGVIISARATNTDYSKKNLESQSPSGLRRPSHLKTWFRRHFVLPALFGRKHIETVGYYQLPTRGQTLLITSYILLNVSFLATDYGRDGRSVNAMGNRAGHLSMVQMPIMFLFAGRNNLLIWITGWSYNEFQVFHKWIARVATLEAILHSACYGYFAAQKQWKNSDKTYYDAWMNGIAATSVMSLVMCFSMMTVRRRWFEFFRIIHILGGILFLIFLFFHVRSMPNGYTPYIWTCVSIWLVDRFLRMVRLCYFNRNGRQTAKIKLIGNSTLRVTVEVNIPDIGFQPGAFYYLYFPDTWFFWQSHPFTAASWRPASPGTAQAPNKVIVALRQTTPHSPQTSSDEEGGQKKNKQSEKKKQSERKVVYEQQRAPQRAKLTFLIRARGGMTRTLLQQLSLGGKLSLPCLLEGPYGIARPVQAFHTVIIIAGGVGVSTALPYLTTHLSQEVGVTKRFVLIWSVREGTMAEKTLEGIKGLSFRKDVALKVYITRSSEKDSWRLPLGVKVRYKRPMIEESILKEARNRIHGTPMAVIACGGGPVVDCARRGTVMALENAAGRKGEGEILYWEEGYGW